MCTVTFVARRRGFALGMNRDEKLTRVAGLPPRLTRLQERAVLSPGEPNGGTWIGVNDSGAALALINWYSITARVAGQPISRGDVVRDSLSATSPAEVDGALARWPLDRVNPFRLVGVFPASQSVVEWRWNLDRLKRLEHPWQTNTWISSGFDEPGAQRTRGRVFHESLRQRSVGTLRWLRCLHRSHQPERGPYSTCMHRADAATVSYTEIAVSTRDATMRHSTGPPCLRSPASVHRLEIC